MKHGGIKFFFLFSLSLLFFSGVVLAQGNLEVNYPTLPGAQTPTDVKTILPDYIIYLFNFTIGISGLIIFGILVYSGFLYLTSGGNPGKQKDARDRIFAALLGLGILLLSYVILTTLNPYLVIIKLPSLEKLEIVAPEHLPLEQQTLIGEEIPVGELIAGTGKVVAGGSETSPYYAYEGALAKTRLERILDLSEEIWETATSFVKISGELSRASENLFGLIQQCSCQNCEPQCGECFSCPIIGSGNADPCGSARSQFPAQQNILLEKAGELLAPKAKLLELKKELELEYGKLVNAYAQLQSAETLMRECFLSLGKGGKPKILLNYNNFWNYKDVLETKRIVKEVSVAWIWTAIPKTEDSLAFYCAETPFAAELLGQISYEDLQNAENFALDSELEIMRVGCGDEIPFGETLDNSQDISDRLIKEIEKIIAAINAIPELGDNANRMAQLPDCPDCSNCSCSCERIINACCEKDELGNCIASCCEGCQAACDGDPCPQTKTEAGQINGLIQDFYSKAVNMLQIITLADDEINNLIKGDEIHDQNKIGSLREPTWAYKILDEILPELREELKKCVDSKGNWEKSLTGESVLTKALIICEEARDVCSQLDKNTECYGENIPNAFPNYFCAESDT